MADSHSPMYARACELCYGITWRRMFAASSAAVHADSRNPAFIAHTRRASGPLAADVQTVPNVQPGNSMPMTALLAART